jgi:hypothetical protein
MNFSSQLCLDNLVESAGCLQCPGQSHGDAAQARANEYSGQHNGQMDPYHLASFRNEADRQHERREIPSRISPDQGAKSLPDSAQCRQIHFFCSCIQKSYGAVIKINNRRMETFRALAKLKLRE